MDKIKLQEQKLQELRKRYSECTSKSYRAFIAVTGKIEREKLEKMKNKLSENAPDSLF